MQGGPEQLRRRLERLDEIRALRCELDAEEIALLAAIAADRLHTATRIVASFPATLAAMHAGQVSLWHARELCEATTDLPAPAAAEVETRVLARAADQTGGQFTRTLRRAVLRADPRATEHRRVAAVAERRVCFTASRAIAPDGMTELWALLPADDAAKLEARIRVIADSWKGDDERTADQRHADALCSLGAGGTADVRAEVQVTVALSTLLGVDEQPGELAGHGPIPAALARAMAHDLTATWRRLVTDDRGQLLDVSAKTYRPPAALTRFVEIRDATCVHPVCSRPAARCDKDHTRDWADGGTTCAANLMPLCARHHHLKHDGGWRLQRLPDGTVRWITRTGRNYTRPPPDHLPADHTRPPPDAHAA